MTDIRIYTEGAAGRITLTRPGALNALSYDMCLRIEQALDFWRADEAVRLVVIDATGDKAFCAGGDIQEMYETGTAGNFDHGRRFWADEYRMNTKIAEYPKPVVAFMQGYTMGGGVGLGGHASHRIVCETSQIAMPEVGIGLVPDVGGTLLLARAPGRFGEYYGATAARMSGAEAILTGFADHFVPREYWLDLMSSLEITGDVSKIEMVAETPPEAPIAAHRAEIDAAFARPAGEIEAALEAMDSEFAARALKALRRASPLAVAVGLLNIARARAADNIRDTLGFEYEYTFRAMEHGDFLEGIRAAIIDKDKNPKWKHPSLADVSAADIKALTAPLGAAALDLSEA